MKEEVLLLGPKIDPLGEGAGSGGLDMKVWLVCLKSKARLRSFLVSCVEAWRAGEDADASVGAILGTDTALVLHVLYCPVLSCLLVQTT